jgi:hypothetical protein
VRASSPDAMGADYDAIYRHVLDRRRPRDP